MTYRCGYCPLAFPSLTELNIHREHEHPQTLKDSYAYTEAILRKYDRRRFQP